LAYSSEAAALWQVPDRQTLTGKRNRAILAILLGCGLRRRELVELTLESLQRREERWAIVDLIGKGRHIRTVPVPNWVKETLDAWLRSNGTLTPYILQAVSSSRPCPKICKAASFDTRIVGPNQLASSSISRSMFLHPDGSIG
jgi:site-specific recombinase XerC